MSAVTIEGSQAKLSDLIHRLTPGEEVVIIENNRPLAELIRLPVEKPHPVARVLQGHADRPDRER